MWVVEAFSHANREHLATRDRDGGLWILRYTDDDEPPNHPGPRPASETGRAPGARVSGVFE